MLEAIASNTAKKWPKEKVIFAIHQNYSICRPLLQLDLEVKYEKKLNNITVKTFTEISDLNDTSTANATLCIDEIHLVGNSEDLNSINAKSIWSVIRDTGVNKHNPEEYLRDQFPGWNIVNLSYPLRTSKSISAEVKKDYASGVLHVNNFNKSLQIPPNMPLGPKPLIIPDYDGSYQERLKYAFSIVGKEKSVLIILDYDFLKPTLEEINEAQKFATNQRLANDSNKNSQRLLVALEALKACQRPNPPFLWLNSDYDYISNTKEDIKEWMWMRYRKKNFTDRDLFTDYYCVAGYEADIVIYLGSGRESGYMSRCRGQFVQIE